MSLIYSVKAYGYFLLKMPIDSLITLIYINWMNCIELLKYLFLLNKKHILKYVFKFPIFFSAKGCQTNNLAILIVNGVEY